RAFREGESICIYGDYDADGICATAILLDCFSEYSGRVTARIPSRHGEGYGLCESAVRALAASGVGLIVTVDNGVSAHAEIALAKELGVDVVVTDHHSLPDRLPECAAVVTPGDAACGAGVALRLARALSGDARLGRWLPLAALATVADLVPLTGDNRVMVARGLPLIEELPGLRALLRAAANGDRPVTASTLAFLLAPRLNAAGRLEDAMRGVELLLAEDIDTADRLAAALNELNSRRRAIEAEILAEAEAMFDEAEVRRSHALLLRRAGWNPGVIGIVASRLCETLHCPVLLFSEGADGLLTGSGRSVEGVHLFRTLTACRERFIRYGGHAGAAGVTMRAEEFEAFCADFLRELALRYDDAAFEPCLRYDETVELSELGLSAVQELRLLEPFGEGNPEPLYRLDGVRLAELRAMGQDGRHVSARAVSGGFTLRAVGFGFGNRLEALRGGGLWTLLARPSLNQYRGMCAVELMLTEALPAEKLLRDFFVNVLYNSLCVEACGFLGAFARESGAFQRDSMRSMYRRLRDGMAEGLEPRSAAERFSAEELCALLVFMELDFFAFDGKLLRHRPGAAPKALSDSRLYRLIRSNEEREEP
ncbi:MAG: single-stranded-DNA-specific exonuclease RecJ, partial [Clostridia bacterium]|nr:single-stranded-DNA-specific exonuclease RecJ [Clostridia bacterium]